MALLVFDVDHLEAYNQSCGHMLGNLALSDIASILDKGAREGKQSGPQKRRSPRLPSRARSRTATAATTR